MVIKPNKFLAILLLFLPTYALAEDGWSGEVDFGLMMLGGSAELANINAGINLHYGVGKWIHSIESNVLFSEISNKEIANRYGVKLRTEYTLSDKSFAFLRARYDVDKFSGYDSESSIIGGYGRKLLETDINKLQVGLGLGVAYFKKSASPFDEATYPIVGLRVNYSHNLTENTVFKEGLQIEAGSENTIVVNKLELSVSMNKKLSINLGYDVKYSKEVPVGFDNVDTILTTNLAYNFGL